MPTICDQRITTVLTISYKTLVHPSRKHNTLIFSAQFAEYAHTEHRALKQEQLRNALNNLTQNTRAQREHEERAVGIVSA